MCAKRGERQAARGCRPPRSVGWGGFVSGGPLSLTGTRCSGPPLTSDFPGPSGRQASQPDASEQESAPSRGRRREAGAGSTHVRRYRAHGRLITRDFRAPLPPRRPDFGRSASVAYEFVHFGCWNREPETFGRARSRDARRDNPARPRRGSASTSANPLRWPTARDLRTRNPLSQNAVRTPQNANAPAGRPGRSL